MILNTIPAIKSDSDIFSGQAELFKALAHPARIQLLLLLREGPQCVCHIEAHLGLRQAYISQQLAVLREAGLVEVTKEGWNVYYSVTKPEIFTAMDVVQAMTGVTKTPEFTESSHCPCPKCSAKSVPITENISIQEQKC